MKYVLSISYECNIKFRSLNGNELTLGFKSIDD